MWNLIYKHNNRVWLTYKKPGVLWTALWCHSLTSHAPSLLYLTFSTTAQDRMCSVSQRGFGASVNTHEQSDR